MAALNETMTVDEFLRWEAYDDMFPFGLDDLNFGRLMHLLASIYTQKGGKPKLENFILGKLPEHHVTVDELEEKMKTLAKQVQSHES